MLSVLSGLATAYDYKSLFMAGFVCVLGSILAMRLFARARRSTGRKRTSWLFLAGVVCGSAIWTTHFLAMLGYNAAAPEAYEPTGTIASLFVAIGFSIAGMIIAARTQGSALIELGGLVMGSGIAVMYYVGMASYHVSGHVMWAPGPAIAAIAFACFFGAVTMNRIARPVTRFCKYGASAALTLAILTLHFLAMSAMTVVPDLSIHLPAGFLSPAVLGILVLAVMTLIMGTGLSSYVIDTHTQEEALDRYRHLALHDPVTGLPNRSNLSSRLRETIERTADDTSRVAVFAIDLDRFKDINDVHGHGTGDHVLRTIAQRLSDTLQEDEFLARVGGDEFVAVKQRLYMRGDAMRFAERVRAVICEPISEDDRVLSVGASIGFSVFPDNGRDVEGLVGRADLAMYRAKQSAAEKICAYDPSMDETSRQRSALAMELKHALDRGELELYYQQQNDVASRDVIGFEALLRWNHPERGIVSPAEFIPIAEETGLIIPIGEWVIRTACEEAAHWDRPYMIAVNVASAQFTQSDLPNIVHEALFASGLPASRLELEITESSIIEDQTHALHVIRQLKSYGVKIAMDDYGTGYSSLSTLQTFPFDKIKIDRTFVRSLGSAEQSDAIVQATIILARSLNIPVLAEGVERDEQLEILKQQGCQEAQGFLFGRPSPAGAIAGLVGQKPVEEGLAGRPGATGREERPLQPIEGAGLLKTA